MCRSNVDSGRVMSVLLGSYFKEFLAGFNKDERFIKEVY